MKKIIIFISVFIFLIMALVILFVVDWAFESEKKADNLAAYYSNQNCLSRSIEELITESGDNLVNLANYIIFASAENFKKGVPSDLPEGFLFYPDTDLNQVFSFPHPNDHLIGSSRGFLFPFNDNPDKVVDFYLKIAQDNNWEVIGDKQNPKSRLIIFNSRTNTQGMVVALKVVNFLDDFVLLPADLNIEGRSLIMFKYVLSSKDKENL